MGLGEVLFFPCAAGRGPLALRTYLTSQVDGRCCGRDAMVGAQLNADPTPRIIYPILFYCTYDTDRVNATMESVTGNVKEFADDAPKLI